MAKEKAVGQEEATKVQINPAEIPFATTGLEAPQIYADHIRGAFTGQGISRLNLVQNRIDAIYTRKESRL